MDFIKKNDIIVAQKKPEHFDADLQLFKERCPGSPLHAELRRLNSFNRNKIHGLILLELLDKATEEELLSNRIPADTTGEQDVPGDDKSEPADTTGEQDVPVDDNSEPADTTGEQDVPGDDKSELADTTGEQDIPGDDKSEPAAASNKKSAANKQSATKKKEVKKTSSRK